MSDRETKAFIIRQLQLLGKDECVDTLASYLNDESLKAVPVARALSAIPLPITLRRFWWLLDASFRYSEDAKGYYPMRIADVQIADAEKCIESDA